MSYQVGDSCYSDASTALSVMASTMFGTGADASWSSAVSADGSAIVTTYSTGAVVYVSPNLQPCHLVESTEAIGLSWGVILCWLIAWGYRQMGRSVDDRGQQ
ncbi:hypothetical protein GCM10023095_02100 [Pseudaeromonas paramecii]|uniref:IPTL-CTERM sorting domain-containing protein n=1 Tax=Pseudaeromonas paramecii TaxID=2138166 RepID=A0ABP8PV58_9GAMM